MFFMLFRVGFIFVMLGALKVIALKTAEHHKFLGVLGFAGAQTRKRAEYGFGEYGFKHRHSVRFSGLSEFRGASSMSSSQPIFRA